MWQQIYTFFRQYPAQRKVAELLLRYGLRVRDDGLFCGSIELSHAKVARAVGVDRRAVTSTVETIMEHDQLQPVFANLQPTSHLKEVAPHMGWGVVEIIPVDARQPGILAAVADVIADNDISIRQSIVDDYQLAEEPRLFIVTETPLSGDIIEAIRSCSGVRAVIAY